MNINVFNILILLGSLQGILLSTCVFFHKKFNKERVNIYIAIVVLCFSLTNLQSWLYDARITKIAPSILLFYLPWEMLCPPAFYMFTTRYLDYKEKNKLSKLLYLPFLIYLFIYIYYKIDVIFIDKNQDLNEFVRKPIFKIERVVAIVFTLLTGYFVSRILKKYRKMVLHNDRRHVDISWYIKVYRICIGLCVFWAVTVLFQIVTKGSFGLYIYYPILIGDTIFAYWIGYTGLYKLTISQHFTINTNNIKTSIYSEEFLAEQKTQSSKIVVSDDNKYYQKFMFLLTKEKIYLDPLLSLEQTAHKLDISANYLSQIINKVSGRHFSNIIGEHRVEEVKKMLNSSCFDQNTILSIGYDAGFNSKSAIYKTFKKFTGITPAEYRERIIR